MEVDKILTFFAILIQVDDPSTIYQQHRIAIHVIRIEDVSTGRVFHAEREFQVHLVIGILVAGGAVQDERFVFPFECLCLAFRVRDGTEVLF